MTVAAPSGDRGRDVRGYAERGRGDRRAWARRAATGGEGVGVGVASKGEAERGRDRGGGGVRGWCGGSVVRVWRGGGGVRARA